MHHETLLVSIKERVLLNKSGSDKETYHIVLDLKGHGLSYSVGDCVGIYPRNPYCEVERLLSTLSTLPSPILGHERIRDRRGRDYEIKEFLEGHANLERFTRSNLHFLQERAQRATDGALEQADVAAALAHFRPTLSPQELVDHLSPLLPRLYSIASSMQAVGEEAHLLVKLTTYEAQPGLRFGTCSSFLCKSAPLHLPLIPIYLDTGREFTLQPQPVHPPIIMVGPGTGVAPFRGFMQELLHRGHKIKSWLFFGERRRDYDFYYEDFWQKLVDAGDLTLDLAFSRDQQEKIYVQDRLRAQSGKIWQWLEEGAIIYVCGDAKGMAKAVDEVLHTIVAQEGKLSVADARGYIRSLRREKRYLRDVY